MRIIDEIDQQVVKIKLDTMQNRRADLEQFIQDAQQLIKWLDLKIDELEKKKVLAHAG